jgi:hypothetical protein
MARSPEARRRATWRRIRLGIQLVFDQRNEVPVVLERFDDLLLTYLRHYWISYNGPTVEKELAEKIRVKVVGRQQAVDMGIITRAGEHLSAIPKRCRSGRADRQHGECRAGLVRKERPDGSPFKVRE